jgi:hypothetical protein
LAKSAERIEGATMSGRVMISQARPYHARDPPGNIAAIKR